MNTFLTLCFLLLPATIFIFFFVRKVDRNIVKTENEKKDLKNSIEVKNDIEQKKEDIKNENKNLSDNDLDKFIESESSKK